MQKHAKQCPPFRRGRANRLIVCLEALCDNPQQTFLMRLFRIVPMGFGGVALAGVLALSQTEPVITPKVLGSTPLVLAGGTVVDVTQWGHSARDLQDAIVIVRDGRITDVGSREAVPIPKGAQVIDCTGNKHSGYHISMVFTGLSKQAEARLNTMAVAQLV